jgi:hypothetical protein
MESISEVPLANLVKANHDNRDIVFRSFIYCCAYDIGSYFVNTKLVVTVVDSVLVSELIPDSV